MGNSCRKTPPPAADRRQGNERDGALYDGLTAAQQTQLEHYREQLRSNSRKQRSSTAAAAGELPPSQNQCMGDSVFLHEFMPLFCHEPGSHQQSLFLQGNLLGDESVQFLASVLAEGKWAQTMQVLDLSSNPRVTNKGIVPLLEVLPKACPLLRKLDLHGTDVDSLTVSKLGEVLNQLPQLTEVDLSPAMMTRVHLQLMVVKALATWPNLRSLDMTFIGADVTAIRARWDGRRTTLVLDVEDRFDDLQPEIVRMYELSFKEFPVMVVLLSAGQIERLGKNSSLRALPAVVLRRVGPMLYKLMDCEK